MKLEKGINTVGLRIRITLASEDVDTHSVMTDNVGIMDEILTKAQDAAIHALQWHAKTLVRTSNNTKQEETR